MQSHEIAEPEKAQILFEYVNYIIVMGWCPVQGKIFFQNLKTGFFPTAAERLSWFFERIRKKVTNMRLFRAFKHDMILSITYQSFQKMNEILDTGKGDRRPENDQLRFPPFSAG